MGVEIWYGTKPENENERRAAIQLGEWLELASEKYFLLCNVHVRDAGRADFVVLAARGIFVLELKHCDTPLIARTNGPWTKVGPDGTEQPLVKDHPDLNAYDQVKRYREGLENWLRKEGMDAFPPDKRDAVKRFRPRAIVVVEPNLHPESKVETYHWIPLLGLDRLLPELEAANTSRLAFTEAECKLLAMKLHCTRWHELDSFPPDTISQEPLLEEKTRNFLGREDAFESIDRFLETHDHGCYLIEAPPGSGKTSLLATLVVRYGFSHHFVTPAGAQDEAAGVTRSILAQLCRKYSLPLRIPEADKLLERCLLQTLSQVGAMASSSGTKEVILLDGVDALRDPQHSDIALPPERMPAGVYFIASGRPGSVYRRVPVDSTYEKHDLRPLSRTEARRLMHRYGQELSEGELDSVLEGTEGNALFLTLLAKDPSFDRERLPPTLEKLLDGLLDDAAGKESAGVLPVALHLSIAQDPLSLEQITQVTGQARRDTRRALEHLRQILIERRGSYQLFHEAVRGHISKEYSSDAQINQMQARLADCCEGGGEAWAAYRNNHLLHHLKAAKQYERAVRTVTPAYVEAMRSQGAGKAQAIRALDSALQMAEELGVAGLPDLIRLSLLRSREMFLADSMPAMALAALARLGDADKAAELSLDYAGRLWPEDALRAKIEIARVLLDRLPAMGKSVLRECLEASSSILALVNPKYGSMALEFLSPGWCMQPTQSFQPTLLSLCIACAKGGMLGELLSRLPLEQWPEGALLWAAAEVDETAGGSAELVQCALEHLRREYLQGRGEDRLSDEQPRFFVPFGISSAGRERTGMLGFFDALTGAEGQWPEDVACFRQLFPGGATLSPVIARLQAHDPVFAGVWANSLFAEADSLQAAGGFAVLAAGLALAPFDSERASLLIQRGAGMLGAESPPQRSCEVASRLWDNTMHLSQKDRDDFRTVLVNLHTRSHASWDLAMGLAASGCAEEAEQVVDRVEESSFALAGEVADCLARQGESSREIVLRMLGEFLTSSDPRHWDRVAGLCVAIELAATDPARAAELHKALREEERGHLDLVLAVVTHAPRESIGDRLWEVHLAEPLGLDRSFWLRLTSEVHSRVTAFTLASIARKQPLAALRLANWMFQVTQPETWGETRAQLPADGPSDTDLLNGLWNAYVRQILSEALAEGFPISDVVEELHPEHLAAFLCDEELTSAVDADDLIELAGRLKETLQSMEASKEAWPGWNLLARTLEKAGRADEAKACRQRAAEWALSDAEQAGSPLERTGSAPDARQVKARIEELSRELSEKYFVDSEYSEGEYLGEVAFIARQAMALGSGTSAVDLVAGFRLEVNRWRLFMRVRPHWARMDDGELLLTLQKVFLASAQLEPERWLPALAFAPLLGKLGGAELLENVAVSLLGRR